MRLYILKEGDCILAVHKDKEIIRALFFEKYMTDIWIMDTDDETGFVTSYKCFICTSRCAIEQI
jgi:hypothetical protein